MNYSNISNIRIKNFKNLGDIKIDMSDCPIIALKGDNEAGKSSVIDAVAVAAYHIYEKDQKGFIRDDTIGFGVGIVLEDKTTIMRVKKENQGVGTYEVIYPDGNRYVTDKLDAGDGAPLQVKEIMGMIREPETKELLHVRTYNDQKLFITTASSTNYKVMYEALKVENISKAIKNGSLEANEIKAWLDRASVEYSVCNDAINRLNIIDISELTEIRDVLNRELLNFNKIEGIYNLKSEVDSDYNYFEIYNEAIKSGIAEIDVTLLDKLIILDSIRDNVCCLMKNMEMYNRLDAVRIIDGTLVKNLEAVSLAVKVIFECEKMLENYEGIEKLEEIDLGTIVKLVDCNQTMMDIEETESSLNAYIEIDTIKNINYEVIENLEYVMNLAESFGETGIKAEQYVNEMHEIENLLIGYGIKIVACPRCKQDIMVRL